MIEMQVMGVALDTRTGAPIVVLSDKENRRALPIWIGTAEASAIIRLMENMVTERPMTHDLLFSVFETLGFTVEKIEINDINSGTYFANIVINNGKKKFKIDSRPSDAIAISLKAKCPIFVTANVIADGTISTDQGRDEQEAEEFRQFVKDLKPSDFQKLINPNEESNQ